MSGHPLSFWLLAGGAAFCVGLGKSGVPGVGMLPILFMAEIYAARESTGVLLPILITGDFFAVALYRRHAQWWHILRLLPAAGVGIVLGWLVMQRLPGGSFRTIMGLIVLLMAVLQGLRTLRPRAFQSVPHTKGFQWGAGLFAGTTTMMANAAGPVMAVYLLAVSLPKLQFVGTGAWFFMIVNLFKVPFSLQLGLITFPSITLNLLLVPVVAGGIYTGRTVVGWIPQKLFEGLVLAFAIIASFRLIFT